MKFLDDAAREAALPGGWDALNDSPTLEQLMARVGRKRVAIKSVLLDQAIYAGIGNWCADDVSSPHTRLSVHTHAHACVILCCNFMFAVDWYSKVVEKRMRLMQLS